MSNNSKIEWTEVTWNPVTGCNKISAGCKNCYAETMHKRLQGMGQTKYQANFNNGPVVWEDSLREPFKWKKPRRVFVNSMSDLFHEDVPFSFIDQVFAVMASTPQHTYQILTKRADVMEKWFNYRHTTWVNEGMQGDERIRYAAWHNFGKEIAYEKWQWPLPNVWIGVSVENQEQANNRIPYLLRVPAALRFLSCEPLLGPVNLKNIVINQKSEFNALDGSRFYLDKLVEVKRDKIDWVIAGGESGHGARPMHPDWVRSLRDQCKDAGVPFFFKQWGEWHTKAFKMGSGEPVFRFFRNFDEWVNKASTWVQGGTCLDISGKIMRNGGDFMKARDENNFPVAILHKTGKKAAGRKLDGVEHNEFPAGKKQECNGNCGMNYCDENGCLDRKRHLVENDTDNLIEPKL